jgi:hypothetical protein
MLVALFRAMTVEEKFPSALPSRVCWPRRPNSGLLGKRLQVRPLVSGTRMSGMRNQRHTDSVAHTPAEAHARVLPAIRGRYQRAKELE